MGRPAFLALCGAIFAAAPVFAQPLVTFGRWGVDLASMDATVRPGDNFYQYVNGNWLKTAQIPGSRTSVGSFQDAAIFSENRLKSIVAELESTPDQRLTGDERKLRNLYHAFSDTAGIEARGLAPVKKDLGYLASLQTLDDVAHAMGSIRLATLSIFNIGVAVDDNNPEGYSFELHQSGLGMPDRDYYLSNDEAFVKTRQAYRRYLADMMTLGGLTEVGPRADRVLTLETEIASVSWSRTDRSDADKMYNPMTISALKALAPDFAWGAFLAESGVALKKQDGSERTVIVGEKSAVNPLGAIFKNTPVSTWRDYLIVHYLRALSPYLPKRFDDLTFSFYGTRLTGRPQQLDRQTRAVHFLDQRMGSGLGKLYAGRYFSPETKAKADLLVSDLRRAYEADLQTLDWMAPATRAKSLAKLRQLTLKIGVPKKWQDYSALEIAPDDPVGNDQRIRLFEWNRDIRRINQPVDKDEWGLTPSSINAYYNPTFNEVVFPAGIFQPPFFDPKADDAVNYGAIGAMMAIEISQAFDDSGSRYDGRGVPVNWWTGRDRANFTTRSAPLIKQYDAFEPLPGLHVSGKNTLQQNTADNSGLAIALKAYHLSLNGKPAPVIDGYTGDQRFFLSFGQMWRTKMRDGGVRAQTLSNEHAVAEVRVIGSARNQDAWYDAFGVKPGDKYYLPPAERVHLW